MEQRLGIIEFDSMMGGSQDVPDSLNLSEYIKHRMEEVVLLTDTIQESPFRGQTFQRLPKHMRRRQMSHYIKRMPRPLRRPYLMSLKKDLPAPTKRPSRKFRRRPGNLLSEYNRRQKNYIWLETHIWHAKRFHMTKKWGYKIPEKPSNKSFKACYRALSEHCLLTDLSYYNCIELIGSESELLTGLKQCTSSECGLTFAAKMFLNGSREGFVTLFHPNSYPYRVIGNVTFMWMPSSFNKIRKIWIWVHPLIHSETVECFKNLFNLVEEENSVEDETNGVEVIEIEEKSVSETKPIKRRRDKKSKKRIEQIKLECRNVPFVRTPKYTNGDETVTMILLKDTLNRFSLTGPLSQSAISKAFNVTTVPTVKTVKTVEEESSEIEIVEVIPKKKKKDDDIEIIHDSSKRTKLMDPKTPVKSGKEVKPCWWRQYYRDKDCQNNWEKQKDFFEKYFDSSRPGDMASRMILSLVVGDPRLNMPSKREKAVPKTNELNQMSSSSIDLGLCQSPIWNPEIRDEVSMNKLTTHEINEARSKKIVPGLNRKDIIPDEEQTRIPILLVQKPGRGECQFGKLGLGSGWDIISPAGFGMPIWLSLIFRGARCGGLREYDLLQLECSSLNNFLQPDSVAGETENKSKYEELKNRYFRLPPNKRANFLKLGVISPFYLPWKVLMRDWNSNEKSETENEEINNQMFSVLRDKRSLKELSGIVGRYNKCDYNRRSNDFLGFLRSDCLVPVVIECVGKGKPKDLALICLPNKEDLKSFKETKISPKEVSHVDENEKSRKILNSEHKKMLKSLRRKRKKDRAKLKEDFANNLSNKLKWKDILKSDSAPSKQVCEEYKAKIESLWIPEVEGIKSIRRSCSREIIGWVVKGDFSFSRSAGLALGYVTKPGLEELLSLCRENKSKIMVLVRNKNHVQYRFGNLKIATE